MVKERESKAISNTSRDLGKETNQNQGAVKPLCGAEALFEKMKEQFKQRVIESGMITKLKKIKCPRCGHCFQQDDVFVFSKDWDPGKQERQGALPQAGRKVTGAHRDFQGGDNGEVGAEL